MNTKNRQSNIELLRIIAILMVIALHYCNTTMGGLLANANAPFSFAISRVIESLSIIAVNVFILITGYFSYNKSEIKVKKIINLWLIMILYGMVLSVIGAKLTGIPLNISFAKEAIKQTFSQWFVVIYTILYLLIPYINKLLDELDKKKFEILLGINIFSFYVWPTFFTKIPDLDSGYGILNFVTLYIVGYYIHKYQNDFKAEWKSLGIYLLFTILTTIFSIKTGRAWNYNSIFVLISSIAFFELFRAIRIKHISWINYLATFTFAVYLIDVNEFFNKWLYRNLFHTPNFWNNKWLLPHIIVTVIGIYLICIVIELIRCLLFDKLFDYITNKFKWEIEVK